MIWNATWVTTTLGQLVAGEAIEPRHLGVHVVIGEKAEHPRDLERVARLAAIDVGNPPNPQRRPAFRDEVPLHRGKLCRLVIVGTLARGGRRRRAAGERRRSQ